MDPRGFDALTRSLAVAKTRRGVLGSLAALGAGLLGARGTDAQVTQAQCGNVICKNDPGKCNDGCVCCVYGNGNSRCRPPGQCGPGTAVCPAGEAVDPILGCVPDGPCAGPVDGASCGTGLVCSGGQCLGNGLCAAGDSFCAGGGQCAGQNVCGVARKCAATPEGGATCVYYTGGDFCTVGGPCAASADCADGFVCLPAGGSPCCGHPQGTCFLVCEDGGASRMAAPADGGGTFGVDS